MDFSPPPLLSASMMSPHFLFLLFYPLFPPPCTVSQSASGVCVCEISLPLCLPTPPHPVLTRFFYKQFSKKKFDFRKVVDFFSRVSLTVSVVARELKAGVQPEENSATSEGPNRFDWFDLIQYEAASNPLRSNRSQNQNRCDGQSLFVSNEVCLERFVF